MAQIYAKWGGMVQRSSCIRFAAHKLDYYNLLLNMTANDLPFSCAINRQIKSAINTQRVKLDRCANKINRMSTVLNQSADLYKNTENQLLDKSSSNATDKKIFTIMGEKEGTSGIFDGTIHSIDWFSSDDVFKLVGQFGIIGSIISTFGSTITCGKPCKGTLKFLKGASDVTAKIAKNVSKGAKFDWRTLAGFNKVDPKDAKGFWDTLKGDFDDLKGASGKTTAVAKWGGYILTGLLSGYENFVEETENNSTGRKFAETIGETVITIGTGALIKAGAAAVLGTVGAPAVAIGLATVAVTWGVNKVCEHLTGKDLAEFASDAILDTGQKVIEGAVEGAKKVGKVVGDAAKTASKAITGWWKKAFG